MKIEATGRGEIQITLDLEEAKKALDRGLVYVGFRECGVTDLERAILREDEMQQDMEAQMAEIRRRDTEAHVSQLSSQGQGLAIPCLLCGRNPCKHGSWQG